jgi:aspartate/methionine/tyrosine aminotransferase
VTRLAASFAAVPRSGVRAMLERASARPGTLHLELGDPDFATPEHVVDAALAAARAGFTHYTPSAGLSSLREVIADVAQARHGIAATPASVTVTTGACGALFSTLRVLLDPGDEVLVPDPGWSGYGAIVGMLGGVARPYPVAGLVAALEERVTAATRAVVVNVPGNPAGNVASPAEIADVVSFAERRGLWVVADEAYEAFSYADDRCLAGSLGSSSVISVFTCSKTYAMTGWRVGYVVAPPDVATAVARAQEATVTSVSSVSQKAAEAALAGPQDCVVEMRDAYRARLATVTSSLDEAGVPYAAPRGAFYVLVGIRSSGRSSADFAAHLLDEHGVAVVPGSAFGAEGEGTVRISACVAAETLADGVARLVGALRSEVAA